MNCNCNWKQKQCQPPAGPEEEVTGSLQGNNTYCSSSRVIINSSGNNNKHSCTMLSSRGIQADVPEAATRGTQVQLSPETISWGTEVHQAGLRKAASRGTQVQEEGCVLQHWLFSLKRRRSGKTQWTT
jgi:hypothetical protein